MDDHDLLKRPIGWWLKEADAKLDGAFDTVLAGRGVDRRGWQVLASLSRGETSRVDITGALSSFDESEVVDRVIDDFQERGWVEEAAGVLRLTAIGADEYEKLAPLVDQVRHTVATALPQDDYLALIRLLARLAAGLPDPNARFRSRQSPSASDLVARRRNLPQADLKDLRRDSDTVLDARW